MSMNFVYGLQKLDVSLLHRADVKDSAPRVEGTMYLIPDIAQGPGLHSSWLHKQADLLHNTQRRHSSTGEGKTVAGGTNRTFLILPSRPAFSLTQGALLR